MHERRHKRMSESNLLSIGIVGFGGRQLSVDAIVRLCKHPSVSKFHVFWNQPSPEIRIQLAEVTSFTPKIEITYSEINTGSAGGYARVLEGYRDNDSSAYLLLMDDDLRPAENCLEAMLAAAAMYADALNETLVLAYRPGLPELADLVARNLPIRRPRPGCCVGFHFINLLNPKYEAIRRDEASGGYFIGSAPWGGLMIPRRALDKLGLPREDFFLYAEDYELTSRFVWQGGKIVLVPEAIMLDNDTAWNAVGGKVSNLKRRMLLLPDIKVFHEVRNRNFMARKYYPGNFTTYLINKSIFLASAYLLGLGHMKLARARLIHRAVNDGEHMAACEHNCDIIPIK